MLITEHLGLQKPESNETFDIEHQNSNMNLIDEAIKDIDEYIVVNKSDIAKLLERYNSEADWIVEQDTEGIWTYRKWNSGLAECWGRRGSTSYAMTSTSGNGYYTSGNINLPSGLFTSITSAVSDRSGGTTANGLVSTNVRTCDTSTLSYFIWNTLSSTLDVDVAFEVKGRWK